MPTQKKYFLLFILTIFSYNFSYAQANFPEDGPLFRDDMVPRIDIHINPDTLDWLYDHVYSNTEFRAQFVFSTDDLQDTINEIGFRLRGNTSREAQKKSFRISFNTYESGREYYGLEKMNLNGEHNDPSIIRSKTAWDLIRKFGIPAPRVNHVQVYINGNYYGLYINVEHIDEEFIDLRFKNKDGNLYKCLWPADLDYRGSSGEDYKHENGDRRVYDLKTNKVADNYSDLALYIDQLNNLPSETFQCEIENTFNVYDYLRVIAMDVFIGNWDGPIYNKNNFYLYHNTKTKRMEYIPYDLDNTFGIDWMNIDWGNRNIYHWYKQGEPRPIYTKMMDNSELRSIYSQYMNELLQDNITGSVLENRILEIKEMIAPYVENDPYYPLDYGFTIQDFHNSYQSAWGDHVAYGILPYLQIRRNSAIQQLEDFQSQAVINHIRYKVKNDAQDLRIRAYVREECNSIVLWYTENDGSEQQLQMYDDGEHNDIEAGDGVYANTLANIPLNTLIKYQIKAENSNAVISLAPCQAIEYYYRESEKPALMVNEFMASNQSIIADEYGDYGDWIEVFNADAEEVFLGDKYLSDNISDPNKWQMPNMSLASGDFALFWADAETGKGNMHTNFKLKKEGEEIGIFDAEGTNSFPLDTLHYENQVSDISQGRSLDGGEIWQLFAKPTPGYTNIFDAIEEYASPKPFKIFPNPNNTGVLYLNKPTDIQIFSLNGLLLYEEKYTTNINIRFLAKGVYFIRDKSAYSQKLIVF